jgi:hypothetical protein
MNLQTVLVILFTSMIFISFEVEAEPACDTHQIESGIKRYFKGQTVHFEMEHARCDGFWAVSGGTLGPLIKPEDGPMGAPISVILHYVRHRWQVISKALSCGTYNANKPSDFPKNSRVPKTLYVEGCLAG